MKKYIYFLVLIASLSLAFNACSVTISPIIPSGTPSSIGTPSTTQTQLGVRTKTSGCMAQGGLPDSACTPGAIFTNATQQQICTYGYTSSVRNVPFSEKDQVYAEYGIFHHSSGQYEVDHLGALELGGSNDIANLSPEAASPTPGYHQKDNGKSYLHHPLRSN